MAKVGRGCNLAFTVTFNDITNAYPWTQLNRKCFEAVKNIKVNDDWEAVRFRKLEYVKHDKAPKKDCGEK